MPDSNRTLVEVYIAYGDAQGFRDTAAEMKQQPDEKLISQELSRFLKPFYF